MDELRWDPPGKGRWELEVAHGRGTLTPFFRDVWADAERSGFKWASARYGAPLSHVEMRFVNGWPYTRIMGVVEGPNPAKAPPRFVLWTLLRVLPEFRRRNRSARRMFEERLWQDDVRRWQAEQKPTVIAANLGIQDEPIESYDDHALADHLRRAVANAAAGSELHFQLHGPDIFIPGDLLAHGREWGLDPGDVVALLKGSSPASAETSAMIGAIAAELAAAEVRPTSLESVRAAGPGAARALDEYLRFHGWRVVTTYDVSGLTLHELPEMLLGCIASSLASGDGTSPTGLDAEEAIRARVPAASRPLLDELLAAARATYGVRDDNVGPTYMWPVGLVRRALLEAGRRLTGQQRIEQTEHLFEATLDEVAGMMSGALSPSRDELAERARRRAWVDRLDPPPELGPAEPPPPLDLLPAGLRRSGLAALTYSELLFGSRDNRQRLRGAGVGITAYTGRARVAGDAADAIARLEPGDVLVTAFTTPAYNAVLPVCGGLVVEEGGALSHAAIVARELGIPAVIGALDARTAIGDGDLVEVDPVAGEVRVLQQAGS